MKSEDWVGHRTGRLTIEAFEGLKSFGKGKAAYFRFRCDCGNSFVAQKSNILGKREDCGCSKPVSYTSPPGSWAHPLHKTWWAMIDRCQNPGNKSFVDYGARGISVCERWKLGDSGLTGFECFLADMGPRPQGYTIERVGVNGNYEPSNCTWITKSDQSKNKRDTHRININGTVKTIPEWCADYGLNYWTAIRRIHRGWPPDKAITTPIRGAA